MIAYSASKGNDELADATTTSGSSGSGVDNNDNHTTTTDDQTTTDDDDDTSDGSTSEEVVAHQAEVQAVAQRVAHQLNKPTSGTGDGSGTPEAQPASYDCGNYDPDDMVSTCGPTGTKKTKDTNTCANGKLEKLQN